MLGEVGGKLVEIVGQLNLTAQQAEGIGHRTASLQGNQPNDRAPRALDDDLFPALGELDKSRELALRLVHSDADHRQRLAAT